MSFQEGEISIFEPRHEKADTNRPVLSQKIAKSLICSVKEDTEKAKALISYAVNAQLICVLDSANDYNNADLCTINNG